MTTKINGRLTKAYVDEAVNAQRVYSEDLFSRATKRVDVIIEERLKKALEVMRPDVPKVSLPQANERALTLVKQSLEKLAQDYEHVTGQRLYRIEFITSACSGAYRQEALIMLQEGWSGKRG